MDSGVQHIRVLGVHPVTASDALFEETLEIQWGSELSGAALERAKACVHDHFAGLYLISIEVEPPDAEVDWTRIVQPAEDEPESNWQVPYAGQLVSPATGHWVFFMHFLDIGTPLQTQVGAVRLPPPPEMPESLLSIQYEPP